MGRSENGWTDIGILILIALCWSLVWGTIISSLQTAEDSTSLKEIERRTSRIEDKVDKIERLVRELHTSPK